jgi:hypothetical protein
MNGQGSAGGHTAHAEKKSGVLLRIDAVSTDCDPGCRKGRPLAATSSHPSSPVEGRGVIKSPRVDAAFLCAPGAGLKAVH